MRRTRTCSECGKRLGSTVGECFECGGEQPSASREERLRDAYTWKILLGVKPEKIEEVHNS